MKFALEKGWLHSDLNPEKIVLKIDEMIIKMKKNLNFKSLFLKKEK